MEEDKVKAALAKLREPFPAHQISKLCRSTKRDNPKGSCRVCGGYHGLPAIALDYVGHAALTDRLLEVDPLWTWEPMAVDAMGYPAIDRDGGMWIKLTVCGVTRYGYGDAQGKVGGDAMKERIGDALRNAAMRFGAALDLWHKGDLHVDEGEDNPPKKDQKKEQGASTPPVDAKDKEYHDRITAALKTLYGDDKKAALDKVESLTTFIPKGKTEAERVKGVRNFLQLKGDRAKILAHNLEKLVKERQPATCPKCGGILNADGRCPLCEDV